MKVTKCKHLFHIFGYLLELHAKLGKFLNELIFNSWRLKILKHNWFSPNLKNKKVTINGENLPSKDLKKKSSIDEKFKSLRKMTLLFLVIILWIYTTFVNFQKFPLVVSFAKFDGTKKLKQESPCKRSKITSSSSLGMSTNSH